LTTGNRVVEISPATFPPVIASKIIVLFLTRQESHLVIERRRLRFVQRARHIIEDSLQLRRDDRLTSELVQRRHRIRAIVRFLLELFGRQAKVLTDHAGFRIVGQAIPCPVFGRVEVWDSATRPIRSWNESAVRDCPGVARNRAAMIWGSPAK
jgi:hypothetical protein